MRKNEIRLRADDVLRLERASSDQMTKDVFSEQHIHGAARDTTQPKHAAIEVARQGRYPSVRHGDVCHSPLFLNLEP